MHIKPPVSSPSAAAATPHAAKPAPAAGKGGDFAQMLKTAQAEAPASPAPAPTQA